MVEKARLKFEGTCDQKQEVAAPLRTLEASAIRLNELFHFFDSALVRRPPWRPAKAEQVQRLIAHLRSRITQAVSDFGLQRVHQDPGLEAASLLALMNESVQRLSHPDNRDKPPADIARHVSALASDCLRIVEEINTAIGINIPDAAVAGLDPPKSEQHLGV